jgi:AcrR family transcriptional regulator
LCNGRYIDTRTQLLEKCLAYFLRRGVANLSLRPLAAAAGTSARMLLHYFGSKETLIAEVMEQVQTRLQARFRDLADNPDRPGRDNLLPRFWKVLSARKNQPALKLLFEVQMLALQNPKRYRRYLTRSSATWRALVEKALPSGQKSTVRATLYTAVIDGLLLELLSTGDLARTSRALALFAGPFQPAARRRRTRR